MLATTLFTDRRVWMNIYLNKWIAKIFKPTLEKFLMNYYMGKIDKA